jgi:DNA-directed RNA polymerase specialized sigma24 family protein
MLYDGKVHHMTDRRNGFEGSSGPDQTAVTPLPAGAPAGEAERLWESMGGVLMRMMTRVFAIPKSTAPLLLEEVLHEYTRCSGSRRPADPRNWLIAASMTSARSWLRRHGLEAPMEEQDAAAAEDVRRDLCTQGALKALAPQARTAFLMRVRDRKSYEEMAAEMNVTVRFAQQIVAAAEAKLKELTREKG